MYNAATRKILIELASLWLLTMVVAIAYHSTTEVGETKTTEASWQQDWQVEVPLNTSAYLSNEPTIIGAKMGKIIAKTLRKYQY